MIRMIVTEDTARVIALRCGETQGRTRDDLIALQTANTIKHFMLPDTTPKPMRWADEPLPKIDYYLDKRISICQRCGAEYIKEHGLQRYCKRCGSNAERQRACRQRKKEKEVEA